MKESKNTVRNLSLAVVAMFGFGFLLVPIYDVFCEITGLNGKIKGPSTLTETAIEDVDRREVLIQFVTHNNESMPWTFESQVNQVRVKTGEMQEAFFIFENVHTYPEMGCPPPLFW